MWSIKKKTKEICKYCARTVGKKNKQCKSEDSCLVADMWKFIINKRQNVE